MFRHRSIAEAPLIVTAFNLSGEAAAPLGICWGTGAQPHELVIAAEPRNRDCRFAAINAFAKALTEHIAPHLELTLEETRSGNAYPVAKSAPQIVVPNRATRDYLGARIGRSLRYLGMNADYPVPEATIWAGAHLSFLAGHALFPGQSMFMAATEVLGELFVTGQSGLENENLATLLAWIENAPHSDLAKVDEAERRGFGPTPDPRWEVELEPHVRAWSVASDAAGKAKAEEQVRAVVAPKLREAYEATWHALRIAREIPEAPSVTDRWNESDLREWTGYAQRARHGAPRFSKRHSAIHAARMLEQWSRALERLEFKQAIEDPMLLAELDAAGRCVAGRVESVDLKHRELKPGNKQMTSVPLIQIALSNHPILLPGDTLCWAVDPRVSAEVRGIGHGRVLLAVMAGHKSGTRLPIVGDSASFAALSTFGGKSPELPEEVPWTHRGGPESEAEQDGSPDLSSSELAALPIAGAFDPEEIPGVVQ